MRRAKRILLTAGVLLLSANATQAGLFGRRKAEVKPAAPAAAAAMTLDAVEIDGSRLVLRTSGSPVFNSYSPLPNQFVVDLTGAAKAGTLSIPTAFPATVSNVSVDDVTEMGAHITRVTVRLNESAALQASAEPNAVVVNLPMAAAAAAPAPQEPLPVVTIASAPAAEPQRIEPPAPEPAVIAEPIAPAAAMGKAKALKKIETSGSGASMEVQLAADGELTYNAFKLAAPTRLVIDLAGVNDKLAKNVIPVAGGVVKKIRVSQFKASPDPVTRVVLDLDAPADYHIAKVGDRLQVSFGESAKIAAVDAPKIAEVPAPAPLKAEPKIETRIAPAPEPVKIASSAPADVPSQVPVIPESATWKMPEKAAEKPVATARINAQTTQPPPTPAPRRGRNLSAPPPPSAATAATAVAPPPEDVFNEQAPVVGSTPQPASPALGGSISGRTLSAGEKVYTGEPISLNLKDADIKDVLRTFAQLTGLNIAVDPQVSGSVTVDFADVPWDQALEIILRQNSLGYVLEGNVMRVGSLSRLAEEQNASRRLAEEERLNVPTQTIAFKLSYARAQEVSALLREIASPRARLIVDNRTNQLVISEIPSYLAVMRNLIESVDIPNRQVVIEARIIETSKLFIQQYGFVWGFRTRLDPSLGTGTGLVFPNRVNLVGGPFQFGPGNPLLSFSLSDVLGAFTLDIAINALENEGLVRVISAPRVTTQDNTPAEIQSGFQIPYQTRVNFTTTVAYVDATLRLSVTPQITEAGTVIMDISVQKNEPATGFRIEGGAGTPLSTRQARTRLMVRDGGTSVIAGIYQTKENNTQTRMPILHAIPVLGNLFKTHDVNNTHDELLIFITPRIVRNS